MSSAWRRLSLRARLLLIGVLGVAVALAIGSVTLYGVLTLVSYRSVDSTGTATAAEVAGLVDRGRLPDPIPVTGDQIVQVVDSRDRVVSASVNADRLTALLLPGEISAATSAPVEVPGSRVGLDSPLRATARQAGPSDARRTVVVAQQYDDIEHSQRILRTTLLVTYPLLLAVLALIAWRVVGAALRPVESLRAAAERISGSGQDSRLPVPASRDEVHALAVTLNSMLDRLASSRARQRSFVADAAHELRSPLTSMRTQLEVAEHIGESNPGDADLRAEVVRMTRLVDDLLVLARLDADTLPDRDHERVPVGPVVDEVVGRYAGARVPVRVARLPPDATDDLLADARHDELRRALDNLVGNAVRHATSRVDVASYAEGDGVVLSVTDDGSGIAADDRERVLERFTRLDEGRDREAGGSGLGLAIVRELAERNGGEIRLQDAAGGGLAALLVLPLVAS